MKPTILLLLTILLSSCSSNVLTDDRDAGINGTLAGVVSIGPICPVEQEGVPYPPPPAMYEGVKVLVYNAAGTRLIERVSVNGQGNYQVALAPGTYRVRLDHDLGIDRGASEQSRQVAIAPSTTTEENFDIDTGIR
ncbi:MAG: hypothetical protein ABR559_01145 [Gemmatimonadota bacterium]